MTATFSSQAVRHSRPDEFLRELDLNAEIVLDSIVRMDVITDVGYTHQLMPSIGRNTPDDTALPVGIEARWLHAGYSARGQIYELSAFIGLVADLEKPPRNIRNHLEAWRTKNRETSERELELVRQLEAGIKAHGRLEIRTGGLHGEDPGWRAHEDIAAVANPIQACATCRQPIYYANDAFRHKSDFTDAYVGDGDEPLFGEMVIKAGREEAFIELPCRTCGGSKSILADRRTDRRERCPDCVTTNGKALKLHHIADPIAAGRRV